MLAAGAWSLRAPGSFAEAVDFPAHGHFLHDLGAFQLGLGTGLLATIWADALTVVLAGFLLANSIHVVNQHRGPRPGGAAWHAWALAAVSLAVAGALALRFRALGAVLGGVANATVPGLTPFLRQKTISLTTYRRDGRPGSSPVSIAVEGDHAYVRSERSLKPRCLRRDPTVEITPANWSGKA